ncbi:hypothetical protein DFH06DRAFT_312692 [Mycena polygramma]|nr:hypothetical protein DFH06DRAFT_312692 [Mycena polygramma]
MPTISQACSQHHVHLSPAVANCPFQRPRTHCYPPRVPQLVFQLPRPVFISPRPRLSLSAILYLWRLRLIISFLSFFVLLPKLSVPRFCGGVAALSCPLLKLLICMYISRYAVSVAYLPYVSLCLVFRRLPAYIRGFASLSAVLPPPPLVFRETDCLCPWILDSSCPVPKYATVSRTLCSYRLCSRRLTRCSPCCVLDSGLDSRYLPSIRPPLSVCLSLHTRSCLFRVDCCWPRRTQSHPVLNHTAHPRWRPAFAHLRRLFPFAFLSFPSAFPPFPFTSPPPSPPSSRIYT